MVRSLAFPVIAAFGVLNVVGNAEAIDVLFGTAVYPVTHLMVLDPRGLVDVPARHRGVLRRRDRVPRAIARLADVTDAMPVPDWVQGGQFHRVSSPSSSR